MKFYCYKGCATCKKAAKWLQEHGIETPMLPIREQPPSIEELRTALKAKGSIKPLFNTSGRDYRTMHMKEKLPHMSDSEALELLSQNGNLIKRPFLIDGDKVLIGFKPAEWDAFFNS